MYLGGLNEVREVMRKDQMEEQPLNDLSRLGVTDQLKVANGKSISFVYLLSISTATRSSLLPTEPASVGKRVKCDKDRCAYCTNSQQAAAAQNLVVHSAVGVLATDCRCGANLFARDTRRGKALTWNSSSYDKMGGPRR